MSHRCGCEGESKKKETKTEWLLCAAGEGGCRHNGTLMVKLAKGKKKITTSSNFFPFMIISSP